MFWKQSAFMWMRCTPSTRDIPDPVLSREMDRMETAGRAIAEEVTRDPAKAPRWTGLPGITCPKR